MCHVEKKSVCRTEYKEVCKPVYRKPTYQTAAFHGKKCEKVPEEKCELVDENKCAKVPEKVCKKVKEDKCLTIPEETCRDVPTKECRKVPKFVPSNNPIKVSLALHGIDMLIMSLSRNVRSARLMRMTSQTWFMTKSVSVMRSPSVTQLTSR